MQGDKVNPLAKLVDTLSRRALSLARALHVHAEATVGESRDMAKSLANEKKAAESVANDLIPTRGPVYLVGLEKMTCRFIVIFYRACFMRVAYTVPYIFDSILL